MKTENTKILVGVILLAMIIVTIPYLIRMWNGNPYIPNSEAYYNLRFLESHSESSYDGLTQRHIPLNIINEISVDAKYSLWGSKILLLLLGIASVVMSYLILKNHNMGEKNIWAVLLFLVASPIFTYTFMDYNVYSIMIFLNLSIAYLLMKEKIVLSTLIFIITPFIDIYGAIVSLIFMTVYIIANARSYKKYQIFFIIAALSIVSAVIVNALLGYSIFSINPFSKSNIITDIGADIGFSFSSFILSIIGLILLWEKGWKNVMIYGSIILFIILAIFNNFLRIYLNFLLAIYAGFAFIHLSRRKWSISIIKRITILLIICSILFTTLVYTTKLIKSEPNPDYVDALVFLKNQSFPREKILSSEQNGYLIQYYSSRSTFLDQKTADYEKYNLIIFQNLSTSRNLDRTEALLKDNNIRYIFIDQAFKEYLQEKDGLWFLIETSNKFKNIYKNTNVEVWMYTG